MHDDVADRQIGERRELGAALVLRPAERPPPRAEDLALGEHDDAECRDRKSSGAVSDDDRQRLCAVERRRDRRLDVVLAQDLAHVLRLTVVGGGESHAETLGAPASEVRGELLEATGEARDLERLQREFRRGGGARGGAGGAGDQAELDELTSADPLAERRAGCRFLGRAVEQLRQVEAR